MERFIEINDNFCYDCLNNKLIKMKFKKCIVSTKHRFIPPYDNEFLRSNLEIGRQQLILSVTDNCNFMCEYCVYHDTKLSSTKKNFMDFEIAKMAIDDYIMHSKNCEKRCIAFYGGEPLLNFELIKKCVEYINSLNDLKDIHFLLTTNAYLIDKKIADFLLKNRFFVNISLDGPEYTHDRYRKLRDKTTTFRKIVNAAKILISTNPAYWGKNLSFLGVLAKPIHADSVNDFFQLMPFNYFLSDLETTPHMEWVLKNYSSEIYDETPLSKINLNRINTIDRGVLNEIRSIRHVLNSQHPFMSPFCPGRYCLPGLKRLFVSTNGDYYVCEKADQNKDMMVGHVTTGIDYTKISYLQEKAFALHSQNCNSCWAARFCHMCFVTLNKFPDCCKFFKNNIIFAMQQMLEDYYD